MRYLSMLPLLFLTALLWGQQPDDKRMKLEIEVAEKILDELIQNILTDDFQAYQVDGTYLNSYGMLLTIKSKWGGFAINPRVIISNDNYFPRGQARERRDRSERSARAYTIHRDSTHGMTNENFRMVVESFITDYGYLLTQLPEEERICIKYSDAKGFDYGFAIAGISTSDRGSDSYGNGFTAVIQQKLVQEHRLGKLDKDALIKKIEYSETEAVNSETDREIVLLHSIFNRLYQRDLSDGFYMRGKGRLEKIAGLGALFSYSFSGRHSDLFELSGKAYLLLQDRLGNNEDNVLQELKAEDESEEEEPDFDAFLEGFKANVITYGSTVRNLQADEVLSFELKLPPCKDCDDRPEKVKITAKQALLKKYRQGHIKLEAAVEELEVNY